MTIKDRWDIGLLLFFVIVTVCAMNDPFLLGGWIILVLLWLRAHKKGMYLSWIDIGVLILWGYDLVSLLTTMNGMTSCLAIIPVTLVVFYYFVLRFEFQDKQKFKMLFYFLSVFIGILGWFGLIAFGIFSSSIREMGWLNLYDFRFLHRPLGNIANVWGSLLIMFFMIVYITLMLYRKQKKNVIILWICLFPIIFGLITSFSRGVYVAFFILLLLCIGLCLKGRGTIRKKIGVIVGLCCCISLPVVFCSQEIGTTLRMTETVSQQRSIEGRVEGSLAIVGMLKKAPLVGAGIGNYTLIANADRYEDDLISYTNFAPNLFVQLLAEKGILGFALWGMFAICLLYYSFRYRRNKLIIFLGGCFLILLVREATFPVFLNTPGLMVLGVTLLAFGQNIVYQKKESKELSPVISRYVLIGCVVLFVGMYVNLMLHYKNEKYNHDFLKAVENKEYDKALEMIEKTSKSIPYLINRSLIYSLEEEWGKAEYYTQLAIEKNPLDIQLQYNLARIYVQSGKENLAQKIMEDLVKAYPNNFLYQWGMFDLYYTKGEKTAAILCLIQAVELAPRIMDSPFWTELLQRDREMVLVIQEQLKGRIKEIPDGPIVLANRAKIALSLKDTVRAEELYKKVVDILPNLTYPWFYLGQIEWNRGNTDKGIKYLKRFMRLANGSFFSSENMEEYIMSGKLFDRVKQRPFFSTKYLNKFAVWYGSNTIELSVLDEVKMFDAEV